MSAPVSQRRARGANPGDGKLYRLLGWVVARGLRARLRDAGRQSRLLVSVLVGFTLGYLVVGYALFHHGLAYVDRFPVVGPLLSQRVLYLIFLFFLLMLVFSNVVIGYSALFRSAETEWLLSLPVRHEDVYRWKTIESLVVSSWATLFLGAPMMLAFGQVNRVPPQFYLQAGAAFFPFLLIPAAVGAWILLGLIRSLPSRLFKLALGALAVAGVVWLLLSVRPATSEDSASAAELLSFDALLRHSRVSLHPLLPSAWMARCLLCWSDGILGEALFYFLLLLSNGLFAILLCFKLGGILFYPSWTASRDRRARASHDRSAARARARCAAAPAALARRPWLERVVDALPFPSRPTRALLLKDARIFWRDPTQWTQFLIFFGLLGLYVLNLRNVSAEFGSPFWATVISFLNLGACALTLSTLTTRFVFPQFSLEGRRLWIVGMAPMGLGRVVLQKFLASAAGAMAITVTLMVSSSVTLRLAWGQVWLFGGAIAAMSVALSGLAVGVGTLFPNLKEENPSKIVSGFGGTLCLVLSFLYLLVAISILAIPAALELAPVRPRHPDPGTARAFAVALVSLLSAATAAIPLALALRRAKALEF